MWDDVIGEYEGLRSIDCAWNLSKKCYDATRGGCYICLSLVFGPCLACCAGIHFACLAFQVSHFYRVNTAECYTIKGAELTQEKLKFYFHIYSMCGVWDHSSVHTK